MAPALPFAGAITGVAAAGTVTAPILFGNNIQRQEDEVAAGRKDSVDVGAALTPHLDKQHLKVLLIRYC